MTKDVLTNFYDKCKSVGIDQIAMHIVGGNKNVMTNSDSALFKLGADAITMIETSMNFGKFNKPFVIYNIEYENVDAIYAPNLSTTEATALLTELGVYDDDFKAFIKGLGARSDLRPGTAGLSVMKNDLGETIVGDNSPGYVTK